MEAPRTSILPAGTAEPGRPPRPGHAPSRPSRASETPGTDRQRRWSIRGRTRGVGAVSSAHRWAPLRGARRAERACRFASCSPSRCGRATTIESVRASRPRRQYGIRPSRSCSLVGRGGSATTAGSHRPATPDRRPSPESGPSRQDPGAEASSHAGACRPPSSSTDRPGPRATAARCRAPSAPPPASLARGS